MRLLKNLPEQPQELDSLIPYKEGMVVSKSFSRSEGTSIMLMSVSEGEEVTSEQYPGDMFYYVVDGVMPINIKGQTYELTAGQIMAVQADTPHAIGGKGAFKVLEITLTK